MSNQTQFSVDVEKWTQKVSNNIRKFAVELSQDILYGVVTKTPVITGFLRSSWNLSLDAPVVVDGEKTGNPNASLQLAVSRGALTLAKMKGGETVYITNGTEYGQHVEYGTSNFEGRAMMRKTIAEIPRLAEEAVRRIQSGEEWRPQ